MLAIVFGTESFWGKDQKAYLVHYLFNNSRSFLRCVALPEVSFGIKMREIPIAYFFSLVNSWRRCLL